MLKPISKIALVLVFTFLSGLVMTDCILPEIQSEERAEIEIEEEREFESVEHIQNILVSKILIDKGGKRIHLKNIQQLTDFAANSSSFFLEIPLITPCTQIKTVHSYKRLPKYILFGSLKLFS